MAIDLIGIMDDLGKAMGGVEKHLDSELKDFSKNATKDEAEKISSQIPEVINAVNAAKQQMAKVHYGAKKRQEKQNQ